MSNKNQDRANRAYRTLLVYQQLSGMSEHESAVVDLLTDLRHLAADYAIEFDDAVRISEAHFDAEVAGE